MLIYPQKPPMKYKAYRTNHNPWVDADGTRYFDGNVSTDVADAIHQYLDDYFSERRIGVYNPNRFQTLFRAQLKKYEPNFYKALTLDDHYPELEDMINDTFTTVEGSNNATKTGMNTNTRTDNLAHDVNRIQKPYAVDTDITYNNLRDSRTIDRETESTNTNTLNVEQNGTERNLNSDTPHSNVSPATTGLDTPITWKYASGLQDTLNKNETINEGNSNDNTTETGNDVNVRTGGITTTQSYDQIENNETGTNTGTVVNEGDTSEKTTGSNNVTTKGRNTNEALLSQEWKDYLYNYISAIHFLMHHLENVFYSTFDDEDYYVYDTSLDD